MTTTPLPHPASPDAPAPPADIGARLPGLIDGIRGPGDLSAERIARLTGHAVQVDPEDPGRYGFAARVGAWACHLSTIPARGGGAPTRLAVSYDALDADAGAVAPAAPAFEPFARALREAGYAQSAVPGPRGAGYGHRFERDGVQVTVQTDREDPGADPVLLRLTRLTVIAAQARHD